MIHQIHQSTGHGIRPICATLEVPRSSYYHAAEATARQLVDREIGDRIEAIFRQHQRRYGYRRIWEELSDHAVVCAPDRVRRIMMQRGLRAIQPRNYVPRTSDGRADKPSPNLLLDQPLPSKPDRVWAGDITFIPTASGWLYLAVIIDLCTRRIVGWSLADHLRSELVGDALKQALESRRPPSGLIFHSDRGSQYGSREYRHLLQQASMDQSMSARANPYHNAWTESFMGTLKKEMLRGGCFLNKKDARTEIFAYIESYYNTQRKHSALGYMSPTGYESQITTLN
jgi:transposase InsO family protein